MDQKRRLRILRSIVLAIEECEMYTGETMMNAALYYGSRFSISEDEIEEFLGMTLRQIVKEIVDEL